MFVVFLRTFGLGLMSMGLALARIESPNDSFQSLTGLAWRRPWLAAVLTAAMFSLAGIPLTAGFMGKAYLVAGGAAAGQWGLLVVLVVSSAIGLYYYLRVVMALYLTPSEGEHPQPAPRVPFAAGLALGLLLVLLVWLGAYPGPAMDLIAGLVGGLR